MIRLSSLNPYALYIKIGLVVLVVAGFFATGLWIRGVFSERAALRQSEALAQQSLKMYAQQLQDNINLQREVTDAIKNIKIRNTNNIQTIESQPPPVVADGADFVLVPAGLPHAAPLPGLPRFADYSSGRGAADPAPDQWSQAGR